MAPGSKNGYSQGGWLSLTLVAVAARSAVTCERDCLGGVRENQEEVILVTHDVVWYSVCLCVCVCVCVCALCAHCKGMSLCLKDNNTVLF